jgi:hypothetical protein
MTVIPPIDLDSAATEAFEDFQQVHLQWERNQTDARWSVRQNAFQRFNDVFDAFLAEERS